MTEAVAEEIVVGDTTQNQRVFNASARVHPIDRFLTVRNQSQCSRNSSKNSISHRMKNACKKWFEVGYVVAVGI